MILSRITIFILSIFIVSCGKEQSKDSSLAEVDKSIIAITVAAEAKNQIKNLHQSVQTYYTQYGSMPGDCYEEMESKGEIEVPQATIDAWKFGCDWEFDESTGEVTGQIIATSTDDNAAGSGKVVIYDLFTGEYTGYGQGGE